MLAFDDFAKTINHQLAAKLYAWVAEVYSMKTLSTLLLVFVPFAAYAGDCQRPFPILGFSGKEMHFQVTSHGKQTSSIVGLYSEKRLEDHNF
jgi:hypothetical protein